MRFHNILFTAVSGLLLAACNKDIKLKSLSFDASAGAGTYATADTIRFNLTGNPDFITFYSGLPGNRYAYRNRTAAAGTPVLRFTSARANGTQTNSLQLMISADFKGIDTSNTTTLSNIAAANWKDITDRATLSTGAALASGPVDLTDQIGDKPVYIAFKYTSVSGSKQNKWTITGLNVNNTLADSTTYLIANLNAGNTAITNYGATTYSPGWVSYKVVNNYNWVVTAGTSLVITGAAAADQATQNAEAWAIMGPLDLKKVTPDWGIPIKNIGENMSKFPYKYIYTSPGAYDATFLASNANRDRQDSIVKNIRLNVH
ncbi:DUF5017 domain-containing protein [Chitinophaga arvensicola]|uniref:DUF5017 domain-containing protein n=1 Tax=Chitinophaga arvensicola TaxID=29529 RepID=A0A1I0R4G3_9BACT|nr:DUF5017 domain-containing protein [Chitinophaga arvensicola]SEW35317.1 protein of unknown function [Chitinophaga arvensicola]